LKLCRFSYFTVVEYVYACALRVSKTLSALKICKWLHFSWLFERDCYARSLVSFWEISSTWNRYFKATPISSVFKNIVKKSTCLSSFRDSVDAIFTLQ
jgi:hypothetical protein